jgi:hypothetical protein
MKISTETDEMLKQPDRTTGDMIGKTREPSKSHVMITN